MIAAPKDKARTIQRIVHSSIVAIPKTNAPPTLEGRRRESKKYFTQL
jgi:hypothetical protein